MGDRLLVVEDHPDLLDFCVETLANAGYDVVGVASGTDAERVLQGPPS